jgi:hypothetical protein
MSARRLLRIVLSLVILIWLWTRAWREWHDRSGLWLLGSITLSVILVLVIVMEVTGAQNKWKQMRDRVPKNPLGLDS